MTPSIDVFSQGGPLIESMFDSEALGAVKASAKYAKETNWDSIRSPHLFMGIVANPGKMIREWLFRIAVDPKKALKQFSRIFWVNTHQYPVILHREFVSENYLEILRCAAENAIERTPAGQVVLISQTDLLWAILEHGSSVIQCFEESGIPGPVLRVVLSETERRVSGLSGMSKSL